MESMNLTIQPVIRPLRKSDVLEVYGCLFPKAIRGYTAVWDDKVIAVAGVMYTNPLQCFSTIDAKMKEFPRAIVKGIRLIRDLLNEFEAPVYAKTDEHEPTAFGFLQHIGFEPIDNEVMVWKKQDRG